MAVKNKVEALSKLIETTMKYGEFAMAKEEREMQRMNDQAILDEDVEKEDAKLTEQSNDFLSQMMQKISAQSAQMGSSPMQQQQPTGVLP